MASSGPFADYPRRRAGVQAVCRGRRSEYATLTEIAAAARNSETKVVAGGGAPAPIDRAGLQYLRASGLAQARLQLAVLSGNRRRALREIDRLVEIDRQLASISASGSPEEDAMVGETLETYLIDQQRAIATEKFALMAAVELPRLSERQESGELLLGEDHEIPVVEEVALGRRWRLMAMWLGALIPLAGLVAVAVPFLAG